MFIKVVPFITFAILFYVLANTRVPYLLNKREGGQTTPIQLILEIFLYSVCILLAAFTLSHSLKTGLKRVNVIIISTNTIEIIKSDKASVDNLNSLVKASEAKILISNFYNDKPEEYLRKVEISADVIGVTTDTHHVLNEDAEIMLWLKKNFDVLRSSLIFITTDTKIVSGLNPIKVVIKDKFTKELFGEAKTKIEKQVSNNANIKRIGLWKSTTTKEMSSGGQRLQKTQ